MALERELATYERLRAELLRTGAEGKFAVVQGDTLLGCYDTYELALSAGYGRFGLGGFLVKEVRAVDRVYHL